MQQSIFSILLGSLLASVVIAADVYANFVDKSSGQVFDPAYDVANPGCFNVGVTGHDAGIYFTQGGTAPGTTAHGPYCLYMFNEGGCPTAANELVYAYYFQDVPVNNQYMYYPAVCSATGQRSFQWALGACTTQGNLDGAFPPAHLDARGEIRVSTVNATMVGMIVKYGI